MKKFILPAVAVIAMATMLNGCSKCSQDRPQDPPAPAMDAPPEMPPADGTETPVEGETAPEAAPVTE